MFRDTRVSHSARKRIITSSSLFETWRERVLIFYYYLFIFFAVQFARCETSGYISAISISLAAPAQKLQHEPQTRLTWLMDYIRGEEITVFTLSRSRWRQEWKKMAASTSCKLMYTNIIGTEWNSCIAGLCVEKWKPDRGTGTWASPNREWNIWRLGDSAACSVYIHWLHCELSVGVALAHVHISDRSSEHRKVGSNTTVHLENTHTHTYWNYTEELSRLCSVPGRPFCLSSQRALPTFYSDLWSDRENYRIQYFSSKS